MHTDSHAHILEYGGMKLIPLEETRNVEGTLVVRVRGKPKLTS